jgi:hypothetical protein
MPGPSSDLQPEIRLRHAGQRLAARVGTAGPASVISYAGGLSSILIQLVRRPR